MQNAVSRREFLCRAAALASATAGALLSSESNADANLDADANSSSRSEPPAALPADLAGEAEARIAAILSKRGPRLTGEQKTEVRRLVLASMSALPAFRAYPLTNGDEPAHVLHPFRRDEVPR